MFPDPDDPDFPDRSFGRSGFRKKKFDPDPEKKSRSENTGTEKTLSLGLT